MMNILNFVFRNRRGILFFKLIRLKRRSHELPRGHNQSHQYLPLNRAIPIPAIIQSGRKYPRMGYRHPPMTARGNTHQNRSCREVRFLIAFVKVTIAFTSYSFFQVSSFDLHHTKDKLVGRQEIDQSQIFSFPALSVQKHHCGDALNLITA